MGEVHDLLDAKGRQEARSLVEGRRGPRIVEAAAAWSADEDIGTGYMYSGWCQTALPHKRPADNSAIWKLETDSMTLLVEPGVRVVPGSDPAHVGVPFGAIARLILIYLQSEALRTGSRDVELGGSLRAFLGRLGISVGGKTTRLVREQAERISRCRLTFHGARGRGNVLVNQNIVDVAMFVEGVDGEGQGSLFVETARLSETFFQQLRQHAVPLDEEGLDRCRVARAHGADRRLHVACRRPAAALQHELHGGSASQVFRGSLQEAPGRDRELRDEEERLLLLPRPLSSGGRRTFRDLTPSGAIGDHEVWSSTP